MTQTTSNIYAPSRDISNLDDCFFYHTMDIPGHGTVEGEWDLRDNTDKYLGNFNFQGKRVLEVGTANGYLCFEMEKRGADVVAFDLSPEYQADIVPFAQYNFQEAIPDMQNHMRHINNAYWLCHQAYQSKANVVYGEAYNIPQAIGPVDVSTFCAILLHIRDPFLAMQNALRLTTETVIVSEPIWNWHIPDFLFSFLRREKNWGYAVYIPNAKLIEPRWVWWQLSPNIIKKFMAVLGFEETKVSYHVQRQNGKRVLFFTIVGQRTQPM